MASFRDLLAATKAAIREVTTDQADELRKAPGALVLDIREPDEYEQGAVPDSMHIPRGILETNIEMRVPDHDTPLLVICAGGTRSAFAAKTLEKCNHAIHSEPFPKGSHTFLINLFSGHFTHGSTPPA